MAQSWSVYILVCRDKTLYTGITNNVPRRLLNHNESVTAAKYTKTRRPVHLVYEEEVASRSDAAKREAEIKKLTRSQKLILIKRLDR